MASPVLVALAAPRQITSGIARWWWSRPCGAMRGPDRCRRWQRGVGAIAATTLPTVPTHRDPTPHAEPPWV
jgi:hypothetical protein